MHHAWGISDADFTRWFVVAATVVMVAAMCYRFIAFRGRPAPEDDLDGEYVAFLRGGPQLAVYSALGALRSATAVNAESGGTLTRTGPAPNGATRLEKAVYEEAADGHPAQDLPGLPLVSAALERIRDDLVRTELLPAPSRLRRVRWFVYAQLVIVAVGAVRIATNLIDGAPLGTLASAFVLVGLFLLVMAPMPRRTRAGTHVLVGLRLRHPDLAPSQTSSPVSRDVAMAIGVFGTDSMHASDPTFAASIGVPRRRRTVIVDGSSGG
jgi:uncharacterized protein (TIGR04222 family)